MATGNSHFLRQYVAVFVHLFHVDVDAEGQVSWDESSVDVLTGLDLDVVVAELVDADD